MPDTWTIDRRQYATHADYRAALWLFINEEATSKADRTAALHQLREADHDADEPCAYGCETFADTDSKCPTCAGELVWGAGPSCPNGCTDDEPERCSACGELGCTGTCEQGRDPFEVCGGCEGGCTECSELKPAAPFWNRGADLSPASRAFFAMRGRR